MAQDDSLVIDWKGEEKDRIGELICTIEVDKDRLATYEQELAKALDTTDPLAIGGLREMSDAISTIVSSGVALSIDVYTALEPAFVQVRDAMAELAESLANRWEPIVDSVVKYWDGIIDVYETYYICEPAYRKYAVILNWRRPRGRKLGWRRLNRQQRRDAISWYLAEYGPFSL